MAILHGQLAELGYGKYPAVSSLVPSVSTSGSFGLTTGILARILLNKIQTMWLDQVKHI